MSRGVRELSPEAVLNSFINLPAVPRLPYQAKRSWAETLPLFYGFIVDASSQCRIEAPNCRFCFDQCSQRNQRTLSCEKGASALGGRRAGRVWVVSRASPLFCSSSVLTSAWRAMNFAELCFWGGSIPVWLASLLAARAYPPETGPSDPRCSNFCPICYTHIFSLREDSLLLSAV